MHKNVRHVLSLLAVAVTIYVVCRHGDWQKWKAAGDSQFYLGLLFGAWLVGPPLWFIVEWFLEPAPKDDFALKQFKYSQELAKNLWVGVSVALGLLLGVKPA